MACVLDRLSAATESVPDAGETVMPPLPASADQCTVVSRRPVPCAPTVTFGESPAVTTSGPDGSVNPIAGSCPVWYDGGAASGPVPQVVSGVLDRLKSSWPPWLTIDFGSSVRRRAAVQSQPVT